MRQINYAYTTATGVNPVAAGYYSIYSNDNLPVYQGKYIRTNSEGFIIEVGNC